MRHAVLGFGPAVEFDGVQAAVACGFNNYSDASETATFNPLRSELRRFDTWQG